MKKKHLEESLKTLQIKLANAEEGQKVERQKDQVIRENLHTKIEILEKTIKRKEADIKALQKEKVVKEEIIKNINTGFNKEAKELREKIMELEVYKVATIKKEKKALKKARQKEEKELENAVKKSNNENLVQSNKKSVPVIPTFPEELSKVPNSESTQAISNPVPANMLSKAENSPSTPPSPHTPLGLPPACAPLSNYFTDCSADLFEPFDPQPIITTEYIKNISKITLLPKREARN